MAKFISNQFDVNT